MVNKLIIIYILLRVPEVGRRQSFLQNKRVGDQMPGFLYRDRRLIAIQIATFIVIEPMAAPIEEMQGLAVTDGEVTKQKSAKQKKEKAPKADKPKQGRQH